MGPAVRVGDAGAPAAVSGGVVRRPGLFQRLDGAARVVEVSAPAGSGKTVLLRSWVGESGLADRAGWVPVRRGEGDPRWFWISVADALRGTVPGSALVRPVTAAPDLDGWAIVEWLLKDLAALEDRIWLVIDDMHELRSADAHRQLELLVMRAPRELRFVLATRHDLGLGLHRLRLEGELTEIRAADLRFSLEEARALLDAAGAGLSEAGLAALQERTEGWAAGLRLAALSLAGHPDPEGFVAGFSGSERTVAEYLLAEVLRRQPRQVRRLLLRTSILERVNGELADLLTVRSGGERILRDLEQANAFVVAVELMALAETADAVPQDLAEDVRAWALVNLGTAELSLQRFDDAERHLEQGIAMARRTRRPFTEVSGLANSARIPAYGSMSLAVERANQAIELARQHGWAEHPVLSPAYTVLAMVMILRGELEEGERWLRRAERMLRAEAEPATALLFHHLRGALELARGHYADALAAFGAAGRQAEFLVSPHPLTTQMRSLMVHTLLRAGETEAAEQALAEMDEQQRETGEMSTAVAALRLAQHDPRAALAVLAPILDGSAAAITPARVGAYLLEALAREAAGDPAAADNAVERALDLAERDGLILSFLIDRAPDLLERHSRRRTAHAALAAKILALLDPGSSAGTGPPRQAPIEMASPRSGKTWGDGLSAEPLLEPVSEMEMRVLRFLPTNLRATEIAGELYLSVHTVKTHIRHLYAKLGVHTRGEAVQRARALGLLAPRPRRP